MNLQRALLALFAAATLASCQTTAPGPVPSALQSGHWQQVRSTPPTYFPEGIPADHPTDHYDGFWVFAGDQPGSRFFIPAHGTDLPPETLIAEAQQAMTPAAKEELKRHGRKIAAGDIRAKTAEGVLGFFGALGQAMASMPSFAGSYKPPKKQPQPKPTPPTPSTPASSE